MKNFLASNILSIEGPETNSSQCTTELNFFGFHNHNILSIVWKADHVNETYFELSVLLHSGWNFRQTVSRLHIFYCSLDLLYMFHFWYMYMIEINMGLFFVFLLSFGSYRKWFV